LAAVRKGGDFKYALRVHPITLNPITAADNYSVSAKNWMVESLLTHDPETYEWIPLLARAYEVSKDGKVITFDLRPGVSFHDGSPFTADDVEFSFSVYTSGLYSETGKRDDLENFEKVEILGPLKIRFTAKKPVFSNLSLLAGLPIVPKAIYSKKSEAARLNREVIGTGPYRFKQFDLNVRLILEANPKWWGRSLPEYKDKFNFARIIIRFVEDESLRLQMIEKGDLDYVELTSESYRTRTSNPPWGQTVFARQGDFRSAYTTQRSLFLNLRSPLFASVKTRRALQMLLNREFLNEKFYDGKAVLATGPWHRLSDYADPKIQPVPFDPARARVLLAEDGWSDQDQDGVLEKNIAGKRIPFSFLFTYPGRDFEKFLSIYQADLKNAGIEMKLQMQDWTLFVRNINDLKFDGYIIGRGWPGVVDFNPRLEWSSEFIERGGGNIIGYKSERADRLMEQAELERNRPKRVKLLQQVYAQAAQDQSQIFLFSDINTFFAHRSRIKMKKLNYQYDLGLDYWWIEE